MTPSRRLVPLWQAALWVALGGALAQLVGGATANLLRAYQARAGAVVQAGREVVPALVASSTTLMLVAVSAAWLSRVPVREALGLRGARPLCFIAASVGTIMLGPTADTLMRGMEQLLPSWNLGVVAMLHELVRALPLSLSWPAFALLPGLAEEAMFRGLLQTSAGPRVRAIVISAVTFALFHLDPHHIAGVLPLGFFLAWARSRCGTWVTVVAHVANNSLAIATARSESLDVGYGTPSPMPWPWLPVSLALVAICAWVVHENSKTETEIIPVSEAPEM